MHWTPRPLNTIVLSSIIHTNRHLNQQFDTVRPRSDTTLVLPQRFKVFQRPITRMFSKSLVVLSTLLATAMAAPLSLQVADFATNIMMTSGASQFATWVPLDGKTYSSSSLSCLNILSSSVGSCSISSIDQVGVVAGYTCAFQGSNGWTGSQTGTGSSGWLSVAPPQTITSIICVDS